MTGTKVVPTLAAHSGFIRGHCGKVATKAPFGSCNRCIGASRDPSSISGSKRDCHLQSRDSAARPIPSSRQLPVVNHEPTCPTIAFGCCGVVLIFHSPRACPAYFKGGVTTLEERPLSGTLVCAGPVLHGEHSALPVTRHCQVVWG